jgi:colanic acid biosynthesis glycosyl transferase WcaI
MTRSSGDDVLGAASRRGRSARILIVALNHAPELTGIGKYVGEMVEWLDVNGAQVRAVVAPPYYPAWRVSEGYRATGYRRERNGGAIVYRCPLYVPARPSGARRILHLLSFAATSLPVILWQGLTWRPDVVFVVEPPLACAPAVWLAARLAGASAWLHVQDFELDAAFDLGIVKSPRLRVAALAIERWLLRRFDRVSTISGRMFDRLGLKGVDLKRCFLFPNWVDFSNIRPIDGVNALREELKIADGVRVLLYSGNLGQKQGLEVLPEVARRLAHHPDVLFLICGDGAARPMLEAAAAGLANIRFLPLQPRERLNELVNLATVHLLPQRADAEDLVMPSKLTTMMASARPVLATARAGSEVARTVEGAGWVVPPGDIAAIVAGLEMLLAQPAEATALGVAGRERALRLWEREAVLAAAFWPSRGSEHKSTVTKS